MDHIRFVTDIARCFLTLTYFWFDFSDKIDRRLLSGEVYTASAGVYSAPKMVKVGEGTTMSAMIDYLKSAGYIEKISVLTLRGAGIR